MIRQSLLCNDSRALAPSRATPRSSRADDSPPHRRLDVRRDPLEIRALFDQNERMEPIAISPELRGTKVQVLGRPDWGTGVVERVQSTSSNGQPQHRVTVMFPVVGQKTLVSPPARLALPVDGPTREQGWLDQIAGRTLDDRLRKLPADVEKMIGTTREKLSAVVLLYQFDDSPKSLQRWAQRITGAPDPLSLWSRDELQLSFGAFCSERDAYLRGQAAQLQLKEGRDALDEWLRLLDEQYRERVLVALRRPI